MTFLRFGTYMSCHVIATLCFVADTVACSFKFMLCSECDSNANATGVRTTYTSRTISLQRRNQI